MDNYQKINQKAWNDRTEVHVNSDFYDNESFLKGRNSLNPIELELLGDVNGKRIVHLQCHFGQDTISLARMGAQSIGVDLSDKAIEVANDLAKKTEANASFVCSDVYDSPSKIEEKVDLVFTSYGTIGWLPDVDRWAKVVSDLLNDGGQLVMVDFHPVVWMFDSKFEKIEYRYFTSEPIVETNEGTYADTSAPIERKEISWNHGMAEILNALIKNGMRIDDFQEYDHSPYNVFHNGIEFEKGKFRISHLGDKIPMLYSIVATKV